jgi:hypothetical protein
MKDLPSLGFVTRTNEVPHFTAENALNVERDLLLNHI